MNSRAFNRSNCIRPPMSQTTSQDIELLQASQEVCRNEFITCQPSAGRLTFLPSVCCAQATRRLEAAQIRTVCQASPESAGFKSALVWLIVLLRCESAILCAFLAGAIGPQHFASGRLRRARRLSKRLLRCRGIILRICISAQG